jgi:hypothetical protein
MQAQTTHDEAAVDGTTKITAKIQEGLLERFDQDMRGCFLKRDAFLNQVIGSEIAHLREDLQGKRLTPIARTYISGKLKRMGTRPVNIVVDKQVAADLNAAVEAHNLVRDAFINYLLVCLRSTPRFLKYFELPSHYTGSHFDAALEPTEVSPLRAIASTMCDPFYYLREAVRERHGTGLYALPMPEEFHGVSCYLPDDEVPGSEANKVLVRETDALLAALDLDDLEEVAFTPKGDAR